MPRNNKNILADEWFKKAADDYKPAAIVLSEGGYYGTTCFLAQQIAEKYLKGYLIAQGVKIEKIHDLVKLLNECKKIDKRFTELTENCILLNDYYIETRYPLDMPVDYSKKDGKDAMKNVDEIIDFIRGCLCK